MNTQNEVNITGKDYSVQFFTGFEDKTFVQVKMIDRNNVIAFSHLLTQSQISELKQFLKDK